MMSREAINDLNEGLNCISRIGDQLRSCDGVDMDRDNSDHICCSFNRQLACIKEMSLTQCDGQAYLKLMRAYEVTPNGNFLS